MSDDLLVPDSRVVSIEEARAEHEKRKAGRPTGRDGDYITRREFAQMLGAIQEKWEMAATAGALAVGDKMYQQASGELAENFDAMHHELNQVIDRRFARFYENVTIRGRCRRWWREFRARAKSFGAHVDSPLLDVPTEPVQLAQEDAQP